MRKKEITEIEIKTYKEFKQLLDKLENTKSKEEGEILEKSSYYSLNLESIKLENLREDFFGIYDKIHYKPLYNKVIHLLNEYNNIYYLNLSNCDLCDIGISSLSAQLINNINLKILNLSNNYINYHSIHKIKNLLIYTSISVFILKNCFFFVSQHPIQNKKSDISVFDRHFPLSRKLIIDGFKPIAEAISNSKTLKSFDLSENYLTEYDIEMFKAAIVNNKFFLNFQFTKEKVGTTNQKNIESLAKEINSILLSRKKEYKEKTTELSENITTENHIKGANKVNNIIIANNNYKFLKNLDIVTIGILFKKEEITQTRESLIDSSNKLSFLLNKYSLLAIGICRDKIYPDSLKSISCMQIIFSYLEGVKSFDINNSYPQTDHNISEERSDSKNDKKAETEKQQQNNLQKMQMEEKKESIKNGKKELELSLKNENSDLESPLSNEIWNALFNYCKKMQESISSLFYKITINQVLNDLELLIFNLATKEKSIFSIQEKLQKPLDYFHKSISREYLQEKSQPKYQEEHKCDHDLMSHYDYFSNEFIHNQ